MSTEDLNAEEKALRIAEEQAEYNAWLDEFAVLTDDDIDQMFEQAQSDDLLVLACF